MLKVPCNCFKIDIDLPKDKTQSMYPQFALSSVRKTFYFRKRGTTVEYGTDLQDKRLRTPPFVQGPNFGSSGNGVTSAMTFLFRHSFSYFSVPSLYLQTTCSVSSNYVRARPWFCMRDTWRNLTFSGPHWLRASSLCTGLLRRVCFVWKHQILSTHQCTLYQVQ